MMGSQTTHPNPHRCRRVRLMGLGIYVVRPKGFCLSSFATHCHRFITRHRKPGLAVQQLFDLAPSRFQWPRATSGACRRLGPCRATAAAAIHNPPPWPSPISPPSSPRSTRSRLRPAMSHLFLFLLPIGQQHATGRPCGEAGRSSVAIVRPAGQPPQ